MPSEILMPALSPDMEHGKLVKWLVSEGARVSAGDIIAEIETDKATMEVEADNDGVLQSILFPAGTERIKVHCPIAVLDVDETPAEAEADKVAATETDSAIGVGDVDASIRWQHVGRALRDRGTRNRPVVANEFPKDSELTTMTLRDGLRAALAEEMRRDANVFVIGEEVAQFHGAPKVTQSLVEEFGDKRVVDTPITEAGFAGLAVGAAYAGLRPVVEFMRWDFALQAMDQIINSAAKVRYMSGGQLNVPIVFRGPNGSSSQLGAQHSQCLAGWFAHVPGLKVVVPSTASDAKGLLKAAVRDPDPVIVLEHEDLYGRRGDVPCDEDWVVPIGKACVKREGRDLTICSYSGALVRVERAAQELAEQGIEAEIIDMRTLRPLDIESVVESVVHTGRLLVVEDGWPVGSIGAEICACVTNMAFQQLAAAPMRLTSADVPMPYAMSLEMAALPSVARIVKAATTLVGDAISG